MSALPLGLRGDEGELFARHAAQLHRIVSSQVTTSRANVEDACSFAWLQMLRHQPARETLLSWLTTTGMREAVRLHRRGARDDALPDDPGDGHSGIVELPVDAHLARLFAAETIASAHLRPREADMLMAQVAGFSYVEIAIARRTTTRTVERQLARAHRKLREARSRVGA
jgi:DNA-directed RNA polymerase specialized sigma24 family protein